MQTMVKSSFDAIKTADTRLKNTSTSVTASIMKMEGFASGVGLSITLRVVCDHMFFEEVAGSITDIVGDGTLLKNLKSKSKAYFYVTKLAFSSSPVPNTEEVCKPCHGTCAGCNGPSSDDCAACPKGKVQHGGKCLDVCPGGTFIDPNDLQCKPSACEDGDVVVTANSGAIVRSVNSWRFVKRGKITSVTPSSGQVTTPVVIAGSSLRGEGTNVDKVFLAGVAAQIETEADDSVSVVAQANKAVVGDVLLLSKSGATVTLVNGWRHLEAGKFAKVSPQVGQIGTQITISGSNLLLGGKSVATVTLGSVAVEKIVSYSDTAIVVIVGASPGAGKAEIVVVVDTGAVLRSTGDLFNYLDTGAVAKLSPSAGQKGTVVQITGERLLGGGKTVTSITFGSIAVTVGADANDKLITIVDVGGGAVGNAVDVIITSNTGSRVTAIKGWTQVAAAVIDQLTPSSGHQGTAVTIAGKNMLAGGKRIESVKLNGVEVTTIESSTNDAVKVIAKAGSAGLGDIVMVADTKAIITKENAFTYVATPEVKAVTPGAGQYGTRVLITGVELAGGSKVKTVVLGADEAKIVNVAEETKSTNSTTYTMVSIWVIVQDSSVPGVGDITIIADSGAYLVAKGAWTSLKVGAVSVTKPNVGTHGTRVTLQGERMLGGGKTVIQITLAGVPVEKIVSQNDDVIEVIAAKGNNKDGDVVLLTDSGAVITESVTGFTYVKAGAISTVSPDYGQYNTVVTISGERLLADGKGVIAVYLAGVSVQKIHNFSTTEVLVTVARDAQNKDHTGDVVIVSDTGGKVTLVGGWSYKQEGLIAAVEPKRVLKEHAW